MIEIVKLQANRVEMHYSVTTTATSFCCLHKFLRLEFNIYNLPAKFIAKYQIKFCSAFCCCFLMRLTACRCG